MFLTLLSACSEKSDEVDYNPNVLSSKDYVRAEDAIFEMVNTFFKGIRDTLFINNGYGYIDDCGVSYYPDDNSINFGYGAVNRLCADNKFRRGLFHADFSGQILDEGVTAFIQTENFYIDDSVVEVNFEIKNLGLNNANLPEYSLKVLSSMILLHDTTKVHGVSINTDFVLVWAEGSSTPEIHEDDMYSITGTASGISSDQYEFSVIIQNPLVNYLDCFWIAQGLSEITVPAAAFQTGTIDYIIADGCFNEMQFLFNDNLFYDYIK